MLRLVLLLALTLIAAPASANETAWRALQQGGQVVVMRHASTVPGTGDPPNFHLGDCTTQRNLSEAGRAEARSLGEAFRRRAIMISAVLSSEWCRGIETAELAFGRVETWPGANSFFDIAADREGRTMALHQRVAAHRGPGNLVIVTHQVNITALTGIFPQQAEFVVLTPDQAGNFKLVGSVKPGA
ncbi:histidine phosphatase family protein [Ferrovibrio sp.]|uniref:histidine phosphatase family protein n=1 Tax=Ferrovibrio sp. TaxID=1917215 RepID=UPI003D299F0D